MNSENACAWRFRVSCLVCEFRALVLLLRVCFCERKRMRVRTQAVAVVEHASIVVLRVYVWKFLVRSVCRVRAVV